MQKIAREQLIKAEIAGGAKGNSASATATNGSTATAIVISDSTVTPPPAGGATPL